ncbi:MAG TPA: cupin domain-containing protein [Polyangiaceae bacterium]
MPVLHAPERPTHELPGAKFTALSTPARGAVDNSIWTVELAPGTPATPHQVTREEVFVVLSGTATVRLAGVEASASPGDAIVVPANTSFEISARGSEPLRALCCLPVGGQARLPDGQTFTPPWAQ